MGRKTKEEYKGREGEGGGREWRETSDRYRRFSNYISFRPKLRYVVFFWIRSFSEIIDFQFGIRGADDEIRFYNAISLLCETPFFFFLILIFSSGVQKNRGGGEE